MKPVTLRDYKQRLLRVHLHIQQNLDEPLPLDALATIACLSPHHFHRIFTGMTGETLQSHIRRLRLERAAWQLKTTRRPVLTLALDAGYETHEAFTRAFRVAFKTSPTQYRHLHNPALQLPAHSALHYNPDHLPHDFHTSKPNEKNMNNVIIKKLPARTAASIRHIGPFNQVAPVWEKLCMLLGKDGHIGPDTQFLSAYPDDPEITPPEKLRTDVCITVDDNYRPTDEITLRQIPAGEYATFVHKGPFENLHKSYAFLFGQWLPRSGHQIDSTHVPCYEQYLTDPDTTPPAELLTEIQLLLAPSKK